jgi:hypothetical protein
VDAIVLHPASMIEVEPKLAARDAKTLGTSSIVPTWTSLCRRAEMSSVRHRSRLRTCMAANELNMFLERPACRVAHSPAALIAALSLSVLASSLGSICVARRKCHSSGEIGRASCRERVS